MQRVGKPRTTSHPLPRARAKKPVPIATGRKPTCTCDGAVNQHRASMVTMPSAIHQAVWPDMYVHTKMRAGGRRGRRRPTGALVVAVVRIRRVPPPGAPDRERLNLQLSHGVRKKEGGGEGYSSGRDTRAPRNLREPLTMPVHRGVRRQPALGGVAALVPQSRTMET